MDLNNLIIILLLVGFGLVFYKFFSFFLIKKNSKLLIDNEFDKPQAFHDSAISTSGGLGIFLSFLILCIYFFISKQTIYYEYLSFCTLFFILGFSDDLKLNIKPKFRLFLMIIFLIILVLSNKFIPYLFSY